jgi:tetratricopeptide (TPR) repeat protein
MIISTELYLVFSNIPKEDYTEQIKFFEEKIKTIDDKLFDKFSSRKEFLRRIIILHDCAIAYSKNYNEKSIEIFDFIIKEIEDNHNRLNIDLNHEYYYINSLFEKGKHFYKLNKFKESEKIFKKIQETGYASFIHTEWYIHSKHHKLFNNIGNYLILVGIILLFFPYYLFSDKTATNLILAIIGYLFIILSYMKPSKLIKKHLFKSSSKKFNESLNNRESMIEYYSKKIEKNPNDYVALTERGIQYNFNDQFEESINDLTKALSINTVYLDALYYRSNSFLYLKRTNDAIDDLSKIIEIKDSDISEVYRIRGNAYLELEKYDLALNDYNKSIEIEPYSSSYLFNRAFLYQVTNKLQEAIADYDTVIELDPDNYTALTNRGEAHFELGNKEQAKEDFLKAKAMNYQEAINNLKKFDLG